MKTKTQARTAPAVALRRVAVVAAVLLTLCLVFMMPVVAEEETVTTVANWDQLKAALVSGGSIQLISDLILETPLDSTNYLTVMEDSVLDLNDHTLYAEYGTLKSYQMIKIGKGKSLTITDNSENTKGLIHLNYTGSETNPWSHTISIINVDGYAYLTVNGGTLKIEASGNPYNGFYAVDFSTRSGQSTFTMNGGKLDSNYIGIRIPLSDASASSVVTVNNGEIYSRYQCIWIHQTAQTGARSYEVTLDKGTFTAETGSVIAYWLMCNDVTGTYKTTFGSGTFTGLSDSSTSYPGVIGYYNAYISGTDSNGKYIYTPINIDKHQLIISSGEFVNYGDDDIIGMAYSDVKGPTVTLSATITGDDEVSSSDKFVGTYTASPIGKSYEWFIDDASVVTTSENTYTHTFEPVGSAMTKEKEVSVRVILSDEYSVTTDPITVIVPAKYEVTYNAGEGSGAMDSEIAYSDNNIIGLPECTFTAPEGKVFKAWQIDSQEYVAGTEVTITKDTKVTAVWNEIGKGVEVKPTISVEITVNQNGHTTIPAPEEDVATSVELATDKKTATITDASTGVQMEVKFTGEVTQDESGNLVGTVKEVSVSYPEAPAESEGDIKQEVNFVMGTAAEEPPVINSEKDDTVVEKVKKQEQRANVLAMITATRDNLEELNKNIKEVKITFRVHASLISNPHNLQGYHVDDNSDDVTAVTTQYVGKDGEYHVFTITSDIGFSSYVLVEESQKSSGSATDTGSGNYQYYPRSVPTDGIVDFGTSKVVTGMELPAGSDGTVTLNIKPTFTMPENGYYAFEIDAPGYNLDAKINGGLSFQISVADLEAAGWTAEDIVLFHGTVGEDGKITWEALPTNLVKNENGVAYYKAAINSCSPFYIGFVKDGSVVNTEVVDPTVPETPEQPVTPDEPEVLPPVEEPTEEPETPASPAPILAVLAGLGAVVALRRK